MSVLLDGKETSKKIKDALKEEVKALHEKGVFPGLAVIIVGNDEASQTYVRNKEKACEYIGIYSKKYALPEDTTKEELLELIKELNQDGKISGILVQLPLPPHLDDKLIIENILPPKDVDAFHPQNVGRIMIGDYNLLPCTPAGVMELLSEYNIPIEGKECVVLGRSNIVGKPMAMLLLHKNGTVTICHSRTKDLKEITKKADILVAAIGKAEFVTADMVKDGAVVIDVGMNYNSEGNRCGDVHFETVSKKASYITPVPGGVGPMTIATLMKNTVNAAKS